MIASYIKKLTIARNDRWFAYLHIQNGGSKRIWNLTYSWTGNFLLAWAGQFSGIENQTMHRFEQYLKILQLYPENSRFPPSFKFWSVSTIQKHWEEVKKCILHGFQDIKALFLQSPFWLPGQIRSVPVTLLRNLSSINILLKN